MRNGFTLIEMLVGLSIFALLATAGVGLLAASADTQSSVDTSLGEQAEITRVARLLEADIGQIADRPTKDASDSERPAFIGGASSMAFVRGGVVALDAAPQSDLRRVGWGLEQGALVRATFERLDGSDARLPDATLIDGVTNLAIAYRAADGAWVDSWPDASGESLPRAIRLTVAAGRLPQTSFVYALPQLSFSERGAS